MRWMQSLNMRAIAVLVGVLAAAQPRAEVPFITVASTTSTEASGLFDFILPEFEAETGIEVRVVAVGTGQAIRLAENGDADVLFVHHKPSEIAFVEDGYGVARHDVMYNDFIVIGPGDDPAGIRRSENAANALVRIARSGAPFVSRGDDSGTHKCELSLWGAAGIDPRQASGTWYRELGSGMGATLNTASAMGAYALSDRATWLNFANKGDLALLVEGDPGLLNQYGIIRVDPERHPHVKTEMAQTFVDWILSEAGQSAIAAYTINGEQAFFPNAKP